MSTYLNAILMLAATLIVFIGLAKFLEAIRSRRLAVPWRSGTARRAPAAQSRLAIEQTCMVDAKRRLLLVRCDDQRVLLLTGGTVDLVVSVLPSLQAAGAGT